MTAHTHAQSTTDTTPAPARTLQRACACGESAGVSGKCPACAAEERLGVQPKLGVNRPGDRWEQEADRIADEVVAERPMQARGPLSVTPLIQRQAEEEEDEDELQAKPAPGGGLAHQPPAAGAAAEAAGQGGRPLPAAERGFFEPRLGRDLSAVRIHDDARAGAAARGIGARAYTLGNHIAFAPGQFTPGSGAGRRLLAHELVHTMQQGGGRANLLQRVCMPAGTCSAPISGSPEEFSASEATAEAGPRARRRAMSPARARSGPHAGRARQLENILSAHDPARLNLFHGIFIDSDMSSGTAAMVTDCGDWAADALPAGDPDPAGFASATKDCMFVHGELNREAFQFNRGASRIDGEPRDRWQTDTLTTLVHEAEHVRFDTGIEPGLSLPPGVTTATCRRSAVAFPLSEMVSIMSEFPLLFDAAQAEANPTGPAHRRLESFLDDSVSNPFESFEGALTAIGCKCDCNEVDLLVIQAANAVTTGWTTAQKDAFRNAIRARMPAPPPAWPMAPSP